VQNCFLLLKTRDERNATFSGDECKLLSPSRALKTRDERKDTFSGDECKTTFFLSRQEMSVKLLVLSLKKSECKTAFSLSRQEMSVKLLVLSLKKVSVKLLSPSQDKR